MSLDSFLKTTFGVRPPSPAVNKHQEKRDQELFILFCTVCKCVFYTPASKVPAASSGKSGFWG